MRVAYFRCIWKEKGISLIFSSGERWGDESEQRRERTRERECMCETERNLRRHKVTCPPSFLGDSSSVVHWDARPLSRGQIRHLAAAAAAAVAAVGCILPARQVLAPLAEVSVLTRGFPSSVWLLTFRRDYCDMMSVKWEVNICVHWLFLWWGSMCRLE